MSTKPTNAQQFVADLGAGTFANQLGAAISMVSQGAVSTTKKVKSKSRLILLVSVIQARSKLHTLSLLLNQQQKVNVQRTPPQKLQCI